MRTMEIMASVATAINRVSFFISLVSYAVCMVRLTVIVKAHAVTVMMAKITANNVGLCCCFKAR